MAGVLTMGLALLWGCSPANSDGGGQTKGGSGGSSSAGSGGSSPGGAGGSAAGSGGSSDTGGSAGSATAGTGGSGTGGSAGSGTGGSAGATTGGDSGSATGGSGGSGQDSGTATEDGPASSTDTSSPADAPSAGNPDNPCFKATIGNDRMLAGLSPEDFCDGYEKYCLYTPDGSMMSKCGPGQPVGPLYKDRMDCVMKYTAASASAKACRAGQMCRNGKDGLAMGATTAKGMSLIVNACSHATGYCAGACK